MKLEAKDSSGNAVTKECNDPAKIKVMLSRGWKEVGKPTPKPKPKAKYKGKK